MDAGEIVLWTGEAGPLPPWYRRRSAVIAVSTWAALVAVVVVAVVLLSGRDGLRDLAIQAAVVALLTFLTTPLWARGRLTHGRYTVTTRRIIVEKRVNGFRVRRSELLTDLTTPQLLADGSIAFGDPRKQENPGHRAGGRLIQPLVLHEVPEAGHVLDVIRQAQRVARG